MGLQLEEELSALLLRRLREQGWISERELERAMETLGSGRAMPPFFRERILWEKGESGERLEDP